MDSVDPLAVLNESRFSGEKQMTRCIFSFSVCRACVSRTQSRKCRLPDNASIFSAESQAINMALDYIEEANLSKVIIFSDSLSVLQSINNSKIDNSVIQDIILRLHNMSHKQIIFVGYLATLVLEVTKRPTKQLSRHCR